jgi:biotin synthase
MISRSQILEIFSNEERNIEKVFSLFETLSPNFNSLSKDVFLRGLIELSNVCNKNCFYCGLRKDNKKIKRYVLSDNDFVESVELALELGIKSIVIQSGEATNKNNINSITKLLNKIKKIDDDNIAITLSLGEQDKDTLAQ